MTTTSPPTDAGAPRIGVLLPTFDALRSGRVPPVVEAARRAEALGFDAAWVGDHLACPAPGLEAVASLAAAAAVTDRIGLGFSVMLLGLRQAAWAAKQLATVQLLSEGRLRLGVGVGGEFPDEFAAAGVPVGRRGARLDEALEVLGDLLTGRPVTHHGRTQQLEVPPLEPALAPDDIPPIYVGGRGEAALRRAASFGDLWLPMWLEPDVLAERADRLAELAASHDRPAPGMALLVGLHVDENLERAREQAAAHLRGQYGLPLSVVERWTPLGGAEAVAEQLERHLEAGVQELLLFAYGEDTLAQYERLAEVRERLLHARAGAAWAPA